MNGEWILATFAGDESTIVNLVDLFSLSSLVVVVVVVVEALIFST